DYNQTKAATIAAAKYDGPVYLRFGRPAVPNFTDPDQVFEIGKAQQLYEGSDVTILACGHLVWEAITAAEELLAEGIKADVFNIHTIKPFDAETVLKSVAKTKAIVTAEEHELNGGLFDTVAQVMAMNNPVPMEAVAVRDSFGESGTPAELMKKYGLDAENIVKAVKKVISRK
ncbi:MAG: transketolase family protein, partial [Bacteroidales bacterium]|nr:transketolase family protein [Bacteroidales bacterium]